MTARRAPNTRARNPHPRKASGRSGSRNSATVNVTGLRLGSLISFNFGGRRGGRRRGGLLSRVKRFALTGFAALKGATGPTATGAGGRSRGGSFDEFRASRPDLFTDPDLPVPDGADDDEPAETVPGDDPWRRGGGW